MDRDEGIGLRSSRGPLLLGLMLNSGLVAIDATILATAVPSIVQDLGGFSQFPWLFSVYLLAQAVTVPIYGRLSDMVGRRPIVLVGIGAFLMGSVLCGLAWDMQSLVVFRAIQGLGAGAMIPMGMTIAGDVYTLAERAKVQGYLASMWGIASVLGPALGGVFADYLSWRWIFYVNVPLCLLSAFLITRNFKEKIERRGERIDVAGAALLTTGTALLILGILEGGVSWPWDSWISVAVFACALATLTAFLLVERVASHPVMPLWIFRRRAVASGCVISMTVGAIVLGLSSFIPTFAQVTLGTSALVAGFVIATLTIAWPITSALAGHLYLRLGFRRTAFVGSLLVIVGTALMLLLDADSHPWQIALYCTVVGAGMGFVAGPTVIAVQASVEWNVRGVATASQAFARSVGGAVGVAVFGAMVNGAAKANGGTPGPVEVQAGVHLVLLDLVVVALLMLAAVAFMPNASEDNHDRDRLREGPEAPVGDGSVRGRVG